MSERDPRIDPRPGDVLIFGPQWQQERYEVLATDAKRVNYQMGPMRAMLSCSLDQWRAWSEGAEIVKRGEDE